MPAKLEVEKYEYASVIICVYTFLCATSARARHQLQLPEMISRSEESATKRNHEIHARDSTNRLVQIHYTLKTIKDRVPQGLSPCVCLYVRYKMEKSMNFKKLQYELQLRGVPNSSHLLSVFRGALLLHSQAKNPQSFPLAWPEPIPAKPATHPWENAHPGPFRRAINSFEGGLFRENPSRNARAKDLWNRQIQSRTDQLTWGDGPIN